MLLRLLPCAVTPPIPNTSTITNLAYVMANPARIRHGRQLGQLGQPARSVARHPSQPSAVSRQPSAVSSLQPPASSLQPPASSLQPRPSPERREATAKPSEPFSRPRTRPARGKRPQTSQPSPNAVADPAPSSATRTRQPPH